MDIFMEVLGYLGTILVVVSMLMTSIVKLRVINIVGNIFSGIYAFYTNSIPILLMNIALLVINVYNLIQLKKQGNNEK